MLILVYMLVVNLVDSTSNLMSTPLVDGVELRQNLLQGEVACRSVPVPPFATSVLVEASVVGLSGNPNLFGGWDEKAVTDIIAGSLAPPNSGGYHILSEFHQVPPSRSSYFVCVTTFSSQGTDYLLTVSISDALNWYSPPLHLLNGYPTVWRLGGRDYVDFVLDVSGDFEVSLTPFFGEVDLKVGSDCFLDDSTTVLGVTETDGAEYLKLSAQEFRSVCIRVHTREIQSEFSLVASSLREGPFLVQSIPMAWPGESAKVFQLYYHEGVDVSLTCQNAEFQVDTVFGGDAWRSQAGRLDISKSALAGRDGKILFIRITDQNSKEIRLVATTHSSVEELAVGMPLKMSVEGENRFRDFRVWVPSGASHFSITADSSMDGSGLGLFASQTRTSHDPRGYTWNTMVGGNELFLSVSSDLKNCENGCFIYLSIKSCVVDQGQCRTVSGPSSFLLVASADIGITQLPEGQEISLVIAGEKIFQIRKTNDESRFIHISPGVSYRLESSPELQTCDQPSRCTLVIDKDHVLFEKESFHLILSSPERAIVSVVTRAESVAQFLKNHHEVRGVTGANIEDKFMFVVPQNAENGLITLKSENANIRVCQFGQTNCQSIQGSGTIHIGGTVSIGVSSGDYELVGSFFSAFNSLRIGYKPVQVSLASGSKISWQVGYHDNHEWLIFVQGTVSMCIASRCCEGNCSLQGFGREVVVLENRMMDTSVLATITTENLPILLQDEKMDISGRKSNFFKISSSPSRVVSDGTVQYSPELNGPLSDDILAGPGYAKITSGSWAVLQARHDLFVDQWNFDFWNFASQKSFLRVEQCAPTPSAVSINKGPFEAIDKYYDLDAFSGDIEIRSEEKNFRLGVLTGKKIESVLANGLVSFIAPSNAGGSLYSVLCGSTACMAERDPHAARSKAVACEASLPCEIPAPCDGEMVVVPERGPEYGIFSQPLNAALPAQPAAGKNWKIFVFGFILFLVWKFANRNFWTKLRFLVSKKFSKSSVYEELRSMEGGGAYMQMGPVPRARHRS